MTISQAVRYCCDILNKKGHSTILISGQSSSGKTTVVKKLKEIYQGEIKLYSDETYLIEMVDSIKLNKYNEFEVNLGGTNIVVIEDIDLWKDKIQTIESFVNTVNTLNQTIFILTGIDLKENLPTLFYKCEDIGDSFNHVLNTDIHYIELSK